MWLADWYSGFNTRH